MATGDWNKEKEPIEEWDGLLAAAAAADASAAVAGRPFWMKRTDAFKDGSKKTSENQSNCGAAADKFRQDSSEGAAPKRSHACSKEKFNVIPSLACRCERKKRVGLGKEIFLALQKRIRKIRGKRNDNRPV